MLTAALLAAAVALPAQPAKTPAPKEGAKPAEPTPDPAATPRTLVPFPHPLITEVLFNVPTGDNGDANKDGARQVAGDEFVELVNPHDKPISIGGYVLTDMTAHEKSSSGKPKNNCIRWPFPPLTLKPGEVAVVFNGNASAIPGAVGDSSAAAKKNDSFNGAYVFTMRQPSDRVGFANTADWVLLTAPDGKPVQMIKWGELRIKPPEGVPLVEDAPTAKAASAQRTAANGPLAAHPFDGKVSFSPGVFAIPTPASAEPARPADEKKPPAPSKPADGKPADAAPAGADPATPPKKPKF